MTQPGTTPLAIRLPSAILSLVCLQLQTSGCWRTRRRPARLKMAKLGETLDMTGPPSEAFDRREAVVLSGETVERGRQMLLPIIRTDAGGLFGFGGHDGPQLDNFQGRFAQLLPPKRPSAEGVKMARAMLAALGVTEERLHGNVEQN